tara:strand:- start:480 stop:1898 length:1419 start_codon:yes stop_codon:yes gene_type:complete
MRSLIQVDIIVLHKNIRLRDNAALFYGSQNNNYRIIFPYDSNYWISNGRSLRQFQFFFDCLCELNQQLKDVNSKVEIFEGNLSDLKSYLEKKQPQCLIHMNYSTDTKYYRDTFNDFITHFKKTSRIKIYRDFGIQVQNPNRDRWSSDWNNLMKKKTFPIPLVNNESNKSDFLTCEQFKIKFPMQRFDGIQIGGTSNAEELLNSFLTERSEGYSKKMSSPFEAESACSRLSPHISNGSLSVREIFQKIEKHYPISKYKRDLQSFKKRLYWHCHFIQKLDTEPEIEFSSMHRMCDSLRENDNDELIEKWINGKTGYPFLDACMIYLKRHGWINFRMRAMVMSFASYNLWQPWQKTSPLLAELFVDFEPGIHIPQVQMQSGVTGINLPRIYSVTKQSFDQDADAKWIKEIIPSLKNVKVDGIHSANLNGEYIAPIVDLEKSSKYARDNIWSIRKGDEFKKLSKSVYLRHGSRKRQ